MDIWQEIDYLKERVQTAYGVLSSGGLEIPTELSDMTTYNLSSEISSASVPIQDGWKLPAGWPDLRKVLEEDPFKERQGVVGRMVVLIPIGEEGIPLCRGNADDSWGHWKPTGVGSSYIGFRTSNDPSTFTTQNQYGEAQIEWDSSKYIVGLNGERFAWVELYFSQSTLTWRNSMSTYCPCVLWVCGDGTSIGDI